MTKSFQTRTPCQHSAETIYQLVSDVEAYPEFLPYCSALKIDTREMVEGFEVLTALMEVRAGPVREQFRSRVKLDPEGLRIDVEYISGPFSMLENRWLFKGQPGGGSVIDFSIRYDFKSRLLSALADKMIDQVFKKMSHAFLARADQLQSKE